MTDHYITRLPAYQKLTEIKNSYIDNELNLKQLITEPKRFKRYSIKKENFFLDYSKQRINDDILSHLISLAKEAEAIKKFTDMTGGKIVNKTEERAALHTAARNYNDASVFVNREDICSQLAKVNQSIAEFTRKVHEKEISGVSGRSFTDAVIIGIGGSYLGCEFVYSALKVYCDIKIRLHFLPNVDVDNFGEVVNQIAPESTLWIVISKSYTTTETMANFTLAAKYIVDCGLNPENHLVTITAKGSPGDDPSNPVLEAFHMFDFIGGRYSVSSAVGGLPLSLAFGYDIFERFLYGCRQMDEHTLAASESENIPLLSALISIWNSHFLSYPAQAVIPYCSALSRLSPHIQQLYMESIGKGVTIDGEPVDYPTGVIVFGEPGTNAQHSFFQLAHQGRPFPIEFIGVINPVFNKTQTYSKGVTNHQELWANMIAQAKALAVGSQGNDIARHCDGNRPSSTLLIPDLTPESIGQLLSFYEARTVLEGFILGLNPFDQYGVELGKVLASDIRKQIASKNEDAGHRFDPVDPATRFYLNVLFEKML